MSSSDDLGEAPPRIFRELRARALAEEFAAAPTGTDSTEEQAERWLAAIDTRSHVGSVHHTVPRFLLQRWAKDHKVRVYSRVDGTFSVRNVKALGVKDFYTFVDADGELNSMYESLLGRLEASVAPTISRLLSPFTRSPQVGVEDLLGLAQLMSFQVVRGTRMRRELELQGEWYAKTMASGRVPDLELRKVTVTPHQNELLPAVFSTAQQLLPLIACRPIALVALDRPRLYLSDEPLVVNAGPDDGEHHPDCFLTEDQIKQRIARERRKKKRLRRPVSRVVHLRPTTPRAVGIAHELVLPVSPRAALWWGPLGDAPFEGPVEVERLGPTESERFASLLNDATSRQALDWIISTVENDDFLKSTFPELGPLIQVCDGDNAAALALNETPTRFRPHRLPRTEERPGRV